MMRTISSALCCLRGLPPGGPRDWRRWRTHNIYIYMYIYEDTYIHIYIYTLWWTQSQTHFFFCEGSRGRPRGAGGGGGGDDKYKYTYIYIYKKILICLHTQAQPTKHCYLFFRERSWRGGWAGGIGSALFSCQRSRPSCRGCGRIHTQTHAMPPTESHNPATGTEAAKTNRMLKKPHTDPNHICSFFEND